MKKIEADTLDEAYARACRIFDCSLTELECEVIQHPRPGFMGLMRKKAIIVAAPKREERGVRKEAHTISEGEAAVAEPAPSPAQRSDRSETLLKEGGEEEKIVEEFFQADSALEIAENDTASGRNSALSDEIESQLKSLIRQSCFDIDVVEVDVVDDTAYIFIDGEDAALLIGKEGYRYNALSYLLYNWLHSRYALNTKLEIAQFLTSQQEMIRNYLRPVVERVHQEGRARTRPLDGILVQIALEQLREEFPDKYVAIRQTRDGSGRYVVINEFTRKR